MGKANRKKQRKDNGNKHLMSTTAEEKMRSQMDQAQYAPALETLAQIIKQKEVRPEFLYDGAYAYFMLGDYERAAAWINNTLSYDPANVRARLLLARICLLEKRSEDGLAIFDFVLEHDIDLLKPAEKEEIKKMVSYAVHADEEHVRRNFPALAKFSNIVGRAKPESTIEVEDSVTESASILQALKRKIAAAEARGAEPPVMENSPAEVLQPETGRETEAEDEAVLETMSEADEKSKVETQIQEALQQKSTLQEKIRLLNLLAGGYFCAHSLEAAEKLLSEALKISIDDITLRNMALLQQDMGKQEKALQFAAQMQRTDFLLLRILRKE